MWTYVRTAKRIGVFPVIIKKPAKMLENMKRSMEQGKKVIQCFFWVVVFFFFP